MDEIDNWVKSYFLKANKGLKYLVGYPDLGTQLSRGKDPGQEKHEKSQLNPPFAFFSD